jgi:hypothetical protein
MSQFFDLDSTFRDVCEYPNPADYRLTYNQIGQFFPSATTVINNAPNPKSRSIEFKQSVKVHYVYLPYAAFTYMIKSGAGEVPVASHTADIQRLYLDVHTINLNDSYSLFSLNNRVFNDRFVLERDTIQLDSTGTPRWLIFKTKMDQVMRINRNQALVIRMQQELGYVIIIADTNPVNPALQTYVLLEVEPYFRDAEFANHGIGLISQNAY